MWLSKKEGAFKLCVLYKLCKLYKLCVLYKFFTSVQPCNGLSHKAFEHLVAVGSGIRVFSSLEMY